MALYHFRASEPSHPEGRVWQNSREVGYFPKRHTDAPFRKTSPLEVWVVDKERLKGTQR